jgi:hypothetical protein
MEETMRGRIPLVLALVALAAGGYLAAGGGVPGADAKACHGSNPHCTTSSTTSTTTSTTSSTSTTTTPTSGPCTDAVAPATYDHVVWIVFENHSYSEIAGSSSAPYFNSIANQCALATSYFAVTHPSLPNYIAMTSGSTQGITDDAAPSSHPLGVNSIFQQVGQGWRSLEESMPSNCALTSSGLYAVKHNPAAYYTNIRTDCATLDVPLGSTPNVSARFTFVTPNLCNDMHDCSIATGDAWLASFLPKVLASAEYKAGKTAVFITFDEDDSSQSNQIFTAVVAPSVRAGTRDGTRYTHYSLLRTAEEMLGVPVLGNAQTATSMRPGLGV